MSKIKCLECNTILESTYTHDFQSCECSNGAFIDGGNDYMRFGCKDITEVLFWDEEANKFLPYTTVVKEESVEEQKEEIVCSGSCLRHCPENK